eukprot:1658009-Prorocentrum_lima.AAC.1
MREWDAGGQSFPNCQTLRKEESSPASGAGENHGYESLWRQISSQREGGHDGDAAGHRDACAGTSATGARNLDPRLPMDSTSSCKLSESK